MNREEHFWVGVIAAGLADIFDQISDGKTFNLPQTILSGISGGIGRMFPDVLESTTDPNHREFFHSASLGVALQFRK